MSVRAAKPCDLAGVLAIAAEGFEAADDRLTPGWLVRTLARPGTALRVDSPGAGIVRGFLLAERYPTGVLARIVAVGAAFRRQGVGRRLLETIRGPASAWVRWENTPSQLLFESVGFVACNPPRKRRGEWLFMTRAASGS